MGSWGRDDAQQGGGRHSRWSHICVLITQEEQLGSKTDHTTQGSSVGKASLKTSGYKMLCGLQWWEKLPASQEFVRDTDRVLECTQTHPPWNQHQKGPI